MTPAADVQRIRYEQLEMSRKLEALAEKVSEQRQVINHRIDKIELRLMFYSLGGSAVGALLGSAGSAAAQNLIGG